MKKSTPSKKGEFISSAFIFLSQKVVLGYSPSAEGVATEGRRGSVGNTRRDLFLEISSAIGSQHYLGLFP
ncbi:MAG: hypothetical protein EBT55_05435 [Proteobacteria bacterium]|nr:hypothetical protein [Pseudomonadota bacterium]